MIAEAFGGWLVEQVADATRAKLRNWLLGSDQERALRSAAANAIAEASRRLCPSGDADEISNLQRILDQVFELRNPGSLSGASPTILQGLQVSIAAQLAVLGDRTITGTGESSAGRLGLEVELLTETLSQEVIRAIITQGSTGGPLAGLASQLNHDVTHLQGQHTVGALDYVIRELSRLTGQATGQTAVGLSGLALSAAATAHLGQPLHDLDPIEDLEVHPAIESEEKSTELPALPPYIVRGKDRELRNIIGSYWSVIRLPESPVPCGRRSACCQPTGGSGAQPTGRICCRDSSPGACLPEQ
jgi:hypothetical protein